MTLAVGDEVDVLLERPAHGGASVGRFEGQVVFVRHGIPGERVRVTVTEVGPKARFVRADVIRVDEPSDDRVEPRCPHAVPGGCGGCDWQHVALPRQRTMKAEIVREQLVRLGGMDAHDPLVSGLVVESCGEDDGFGYRTRMDFVADPRGRLGLRAARSHEVIALRGCPLAVDAINDADDLRRPWGAGGTVRFASTADGVIVTPEEAEAPTAHEIVDGERFDVAADGFWQVHRNAARVFTDIALHLLQPRAGEFLLDLYGGAGLFARMLAPTLGPGGRILLVESDRRAGRLARRNLRHLPNADVVVERTDRWLTGRQLSRTDLVILDPPRAGAGATVMAEVLRLRPRRVLYVACDPSSLARDIATARSHGYVPTALRSVDAFPQTAHIETFALLERG